MLAAEPVVAQAIPTTELVQIALIEASAAEAQAAIVALPLPTGQPLSPTPPSMQALGLPASATAPAALNVSPIAAPVTPGPFTPGLLLPVENLNTITGASGAPTSVAPAAGTATATAGQATPPGQAAATIAGQQPPTPLEGVVPLLALEGQGIAGTPQATTPGRAVAGAAGLQGQGTSPTAPTAQAAAPGQVAGGAAAQAPTGQLARGTTPQAASQGQVAAPGISAGVQGRVAARPIEPSSPGAPPASPNVSLTPPVTAPGYQALARPVIPSSPRSGAIRSAPPVVAPVCPPPGHLPPAFDCE